MTKSKANVKDKSQEDRIKSPKQTYKADEEKTTSHRKRKIMTPTKRGTINRATIRRVIKEVIANRPISNEN
jgi:hypothetical protein